MLTDLVTATMARLPSNDPVTIRFQGDALNNRPKQWFDCFVCRLSRLLRAFVIYTSKCLISELASKLRCIEYNIGIDIFKHGPRPTTIGSEQNKSNRSMPEQDYRRVDRTNATIVHRLIVTASDLALPGSFPITGESIDEFSTRLNYSLRTPKVRANTSVPDSVI
ncbi:hypothetical protein EVAR_7014_1 [Eumeta japonica]|uniref:Uncharacterized protein n=1 Tax=Eumeta variegata TaxID=151549 RepID=A0A4C1TGP4_EUMVA|nr:hypothetical protein EVAR_7014_1 [Eumeta japonica]